VSGKGAHRMSRVGVRFAIFTTSIVAAALTVSAPATGEPAKSSPASILELRVLPARLTLADSHDARTLIVSGRTADGFWLDLTDEAKFAPNPVVKRDASGLFRATKAGQSVLNIAVAGRSLRVPVSVKSTAVPPVSFIRDVLPILSRTGCNAGTCHGAAKGKNGFKLSLRGYDPEFDYRALVDDISGRRFNRARPAESLMLSKPAQGVPHQGGLVFEESSPYYKTLYRWIAEGVRYDGEKAQRANRIEVIPDSPKMRLPGEKQQLVVLAHYPDGSTRDVTQEAVFTSTMPETATVSAEGEVKAVRRGEASILVRYEGNYAANGLTIIGDRTGYQWAGQPQLNYIDKFVDAKLKRIKATPSPACTDGEFVRRVYLDVIGVPPTVEAVRAFLADKSPSQEKRKKLVDRLLDSPDYTDNWTNKWADLLSVNRKFLGERGAWKFRNWIHQQIADNRPYNGFVKDILTAQGSTYEHPAASYFRVARDPGQATENVTQLFLGIRFSCNKCHDHPFERWTQTQYYQFAAYFGRVGYKPGIASGDETILEKQVGEVTHPRLNRVMVASYPYSLTTKLPKVENRREALANWLTARENPFFAKSYVNRIWSYFLGKGIIDPVDDIRSSNPPVNPELLEALTTDFVKSNFDSRQLIRTICASRTYQASIKPTKWNADDQTNFSHALPRRLTAEQLVDALSRATGSIQKYPGVPVGFRAVQLPDPSVAAGGFLDLFGRPARESPCECERTSTVSLGQALNLVNGDTINNAIADPNGRLAKLIKRNPTEKQLVEDVFLAALCRYPTESEMKKALPALRPTSAAVRFALNEAGDQGEEIDEAEVKAKLKLQGAQDLMWALVNSPAFLFNR
jgi:hypothetical protein